MNITELVEAYGTFVVALMIALECVAIPLPGETIMVAAAIFAGTTHHLRIESVVAGAVVGAILGNLVAYFIGHKFGYPLLLRYGGYVRLTASRIKIGQYLFLRHGAKVIFIARFLPGLRSIAGILAGANRMPPRPFLIANALGALAWACLIGFGAYYLGRKAMDLAGPVGIAIGAVVVTLIVACIVVLARYEGRLAAEAERTLPGPLRLDRERP